MGDACDQHSGMCRDISAAEKRLDEHIDNNREEYKNNREEHTDMWTAINTLRNRPPVWATAVIAALSAAVGWLAR